MLCLHNLHRKRDVYEEILPLRKWVGVLLSVQPGQVLPVAAGCLRSRPPQLARVTSVEVLTERLLLTGAYSRKHLNAFLKLITCFPELGLVCCKGLNLAQCWLSAVAQPWAARAVAVAWLAVQWMKGTVLRRGARPQVRCVAVWGSGVSPTNTQSRRDEAIPCSPVHACALRNGYYGMSRSQCIHFLRFLEAMSTKSYPSQGII